MTPSSANTGQASRGLWSRLNWLNRPLTPSPSISEAARDVAGETRSSDAYWRTLSSKWSNSTKQVRDREHQLF